MMDTGSNTPDYSQFCACMDLIVANGTASADLLSNKLPVSPALANQLIQIYESSGLIGPDRGDGSHPVILSPESWARIRPQYACKNAVPNSAPASSSSSVSAPAHPQKHDSSGLTLRQLDLLEGHDFEYVCADLLAANGFSRIKVTRASGDYGIDILAEKDGEKYAIQCKCYSSPIGNHAVEEAYAGAAYYNGRTPVVMSNQNFTAAARNMADRIGVHLWGRAQLKQMLLVYESDDQRKRRLLKRILYIIGYILAVAVCILALLFMGSILFAAGSVVFLTLFISIPLFFFMPRRHRRRRRRRW